MRSRKKFLRLFALFMAFNMITMAILPTVTYGLTSGPSQPEFSSFEPVATTNMVNDFTGDFTYNLPLLEVPGPHGSSYPVSLSYHSGVTPEEEASWVGFGWTLNAGAINRSARGIPDDFKGKTITNFNKTPTNWTVTAGINASIELFSKDILALTAAKSVRYNNYRGFGENKGFGVGLGRGLLDIGYNIDNGEGSFSLNFNPVAILGSFKKFSEKETEELGIVSKLQKHNSDFERSVSPESIVINAANNLSSSVYGLYQYAQSVKSTQLQPYTGTSLNVSLGLEKNISFLPAGSTANVFGSLTWQKNEDFVSNAFGYLYSGEASDSEDFNNLMDYHTENGSSFSKRDTILGIPFNDADQFVVTGEGIGGAFRMFHKNIGHFGPQFTESDVDIYQVGGEVSVGGNVGGGVDIGKGKRTSRLTDWNKDPSGSGFSKVSDQGESDEPVFFRFNNDLGGNWGDGVDDAKFQATLGFANYTLAESTSFSYQANNGVRSGRSSFIGYNFNKDVLSNSFEPSYKAYSKRHDINLLANKNLPSLQDNIGELAVFNENGIRYIYGLPVYSRAEDTFSYGVAGGEVENNNTVYFSPENAQKYFDDPKIKVGQSRPDAYATSYLLTEITTPEYIDRSLDGPSIDDFGGYTRFNYEKVYGTTGENNAWYNWRIPFNGLRYQKNSLSDTKDDMATLMRGEKEVYYLQNIETKSHVAVFYTSDRSGDALGALSGMDALSEIDDLSDLQKPKDHLKQLDKIELYPISAFKRSADGQLIRDSNGTVQLKECQIIDNGTAQVEECPTPVKTVHFEYASASEELAKGGPNMLEGRGKLTLKRVYFEYNDKSNIVQGDIRISPYQFEYNYPDFSDYPAKYRSGGAEDARITTSTLDENPDYSPFSSDAWGNYQPGGDQRHADMQNWLDQRLDPNKDFDPAAWQLKVIKLPSGGEIHVQYESDDYQYVQDQEAHVMASLFNDSSGTIGQTENTFFIDPSSVGLKPGDTEFSAQLQRLEDMIRKRYITEGKKIYFKFLYQLMDGGSPANLSSCNAEYITGYVDVDEVNTVTHGGEQYIRLKLKGDKMPRSVCEEFTKTQRIGLLNPSGNCDASSGMLNVDQDNPGKVVRQLLDFRQALQDEKEGNLCPALNESLSYFRVPTPLAKRGGGLRVKRLLTYDQGLEGNPVLYGNEYNYETLDDAGNIISSGVAPYEPQSMREENILVDYLQRKKQNVLSEMIAGKDRKEQEGPIGESIYPGPSVGYSRVAIRNIHSGETNPGFTVNEYFTAYTHPITNDLTDMSEESDSDFLFGGFVNFFYKKQWASQGFSFALNNMHGQVRGVASYAGDYSDWVRLENSSLIQKQEFKYYEPGEKVPVQTDAFGGTEEMNLGREVDITLAQKVFEEEMFDAHVEGDVTVGFLPAVVPIPIPFFTAMPMMTTTEGAIATHAATKVVRYPAILKSSTTYQDGIYHVSEHLAFDKLTGRPVATKTYDEFEGTYVSQEVKASWEYEAMRDKASVEGKLIDAAFVLEGDQLKLASGQICDLSQFTRGDLIELGDGTQALFHVVDIDYVTESLTVLVSQQNISPVIQSASNVRIIRSGRTNALNASVGSITRHDPTGGLSLATVDETNRYPDPAVTHNFVTDLNYQMGQLTASEGTFSLAGEYADMNMAAFMEDNGEDINWEKANVRQIEIRYRLESDHVQVDIMAFDIACSSCPTGWYTVAAEGWD